ncbi:MULTISPECIES: hypothetical protein [unclassified Sphingobacterium]|uniref:hypothetical protein n=1 Tax=unclassified Sphingobacterium TaxID=2609468 RepID=UPI0025E829E8|nr:MULTISPECIES: hypothetical protein [unclassified Sphingobacterium]
MRLHWYDYGQLKSYLDDAFATGDIQPMVVVAPDANYGTKRISYFNDPMGDFYQFRGNTGRVSFYTLNVKQLETKQLELLT